MSNTLNIGSKISFLRKQKNWSQGDLAQKMEASREYYRRISIFYQSYTTGVFDLKLTLVYFPTN